MANLTPKQELFCHEYILDLNATQAAVRAGYSKKTANRISSRLLTKVDIQNRITELQVERNNRVQIDADYILNRLVEIDKMDALDIHNDDGSLKDMKDWPLVWRQFICGLDLAEMRNGDDEVMAVTIKKIKWPDKVKNLELLGRHVIVGAFKDKLEVSGNLELANKMKAARERLG